MATTVATNRTRRANSTRQTPNGEIPRPSPGATEAQDQSRKFTMKNNWEFLRQAFFHTSLLIFGAGCVISIIGAYYLFYEFVKPLMWAVICGITLYPLKKKLTRLVKGWLDSLLEGGTPLAVGLITCPIGIVDNFGDFLIETMTKNRSLVLSLGAAFPVLSLILNFEMVPKTVKLLTTCLALVDKVVKLMASSFWIPSLVLFFSYLLLSNYYERIKLPSSLCHALSWILWYGSSAYLCSLFGYLRAPLFLALSGIFLSYYVFRAIEQRQQQTDPATDSSSSSGKENGLDKRTRLLSSRTLNQLRETWDGHNGQDQQEEVDPNLYLKWLTIACAFVYVSQRLWMIFLLLVPLSLNLAKRAVQKFKVQDRMSSEKSALKLDSLCEIIFPEYLRYFVHVCFQIDRKVIFFLRSSMDVVGSIAAISLLAVGILAISGFVTLQLYYESIHIISLATKVANETFVHSTQFQQWLNDTFNVQNITELTDYVSVTAYDSGKTYLYQQLKSLVDDDDVKAAQLEHQIVTTFEALYATFTASKIDLNTTSTALVANSWTDIWSMLTLTNSAFTESLQQIVRENMDTLYSVGQSVVSIIWNSSEVILGSLTEILSTVFESGSAVIDFVLDMVVFLTFLFTLLCESDDEFLPMKLIRENLPSAKGRAEQMVYQIEQAVSGVFLATLKMATFYGMLAWLTHTIFAVQMVFVPSVLASMFAAVPFFGTYLVAIPAMLELWLIRGEPFQAVLLFLMHFIPGYIVDDVIYSEIKSTNPFLSGMAIAGGMFWWGLEGAIFGPIILCGFIVMGRLYRLLIDEQKKTPEDMEAPKIIVTPPKTPESNQFSENNNLMRSPTSDRSKRFSRYSFQLDYAPFQSVFD